MKRTLKLIAVVAVLGIVAAACGGDNNEGGSSGATGNTGASGATGGDLSGGTLRMGQLADVVSAFDPQKEYYSVTWEYMRCCLLRTLDVVQGRSHRRRRHAALPGHRGRRTPTISDDQLTWTYTAQVRCALRRPVHGRRGHGAGLHPGARAGGEPEGERRRVLLLLQRHQGVRRLRVPARPTRSRVCRLPTPARCRSS